MPRVGLAHAVESVARADPAMAAAIERVGPVRWRPGSTDPFGALVRAIVYQQLAGAAAGAIHARLVEALNGEVTPASILAASDGVLLAAGLSRAKAASLVDLSAKVLDGTAPVHRLARFTDDEIVARLSEVRGIGRWTAEMFLIFELRRLDVWPVDDLGVRRGWARIHRLEELPSPRQLQVKGDRFRPYRTAAALVCWRAAVTTLPA